MAKRRKESPVRAARVDHLSPAERQQLAALGARLRTIRKGIPGLTLAHLASDAHLNPSYLGEIERGRTNPSIIVLSRLAAVLGVSLEHLVASEDGTRDAPDEPPA